MKKTCFVLLLFFASLFSFGQQSAYFLFGEKEFDGVDIYDLIQDDKSNYWFATDQGLIKHDGYSFEFIECEEMKGGSVYGFVKDGQGTIYCHNLNHQVFAIKDDKCSLLFEIPDKGVDVSLVTTKSNELVVCSSKNAYVINRSKTIRLNIPSSGYIVPPTVLADGRVLFHISSTNKIIEWKENKQKSKFLTVSNPKFQFKNMVLKFIRHNSKTYAIDTKTNTIFLLNENTLELNLQTELGLSCPTYSRIYSAGNSLWIANNISGVTAINGDIKNAIYPSESYLNYFISDVYKDTEGNILLSTFDNGVLVIPDADIKDIDNRFATYSITKIYASDKENELFFGTNEGKLLSFQTQIKELNTRGNKKIETLYNWKNHPYLFSDKNGLTITNLRTGAEQTIGIGSMKDIVAVSNQELILALNSGVYYLRFEEATGLFSHHGPLIDSRAYNVTKENNTNYVYASTSKGLYAIDSKKKIREITFNQNVINALTVHSDGEKTYVSTRKDGVFVCEKGKIISQLWPKLNNLDLSLFKMIVYQGKIYANTQIGLIIMDKTGKILRFLNKSSGLSTNKIIDFAIHKNELWVTHSKGVQHFLLNKINHKNTRPELHLSSIKVNSTVIPSIQKKGEFSSNSKNFKFVFRVNTLKNREDIRYHYKLEGLNEKWLTHSYENNEVIYNALGAGDYRFIVKAEGNGGFSLPIVYSFSISAPFYQSWVFNLSVGLLLLFLVTLIYKRQLAVQRKKADQLNELNASRLTAIQSQMNPHFIFNSLNSIQDLVLKGDVENSYTFITKFSNLVRRTLNYSDKDYIDFEQEIKLIELYLSLEKLRFKNDLNYSIDTNEIEDIQIPPMLIQPFIENALIHGLLHKEGQKELKIKFYVDRELVCEIADNGIGREKAMEIKTRQRANHESFAVNAIKRRFQILQNHFDGNLGFVIEDILIDDVIHGTKVILRIPIKNKY